MDNPQKFYITTPIYYVNARPHIGHTYTTVVCDAVARRKRMLGFDTRFLTGTDEHGQKIERSALAAGKSPQEFTDAVAAQFRELWDRMRISYDVFERTTSERHTRGVIELFHRLRDNGYVYKGSYTGQYCVFDELYVDSAEPGAPCPDCGRPTETITEDNYFFKLSAFEDKLLRLYNDNPDWIWPQSRRNEVISFVRGGLRDLSISRTIVKWGIPLPEEPEQVLYVWVDALCTYMTGIGFGSDLKQYNHYWPADVHMIGKEIVRFHCVYWPAFLMGAGLPLPKQIVAHGWLLFEQDKMSKSRGNIVRSETILDVLGGDALRYFLMREIVFGQDGSFSFDALVQRYNSDLANDLGNLASRTLTMITRYFNGEVPYPSGKAAHTAGDDAIANLARQTIEDFNGRFDSWQISRALESAWALVGAVNKYLVENEPWAVAEKRDEQSRSRLATILYTAAEALRIVTALVHAVIPESTARIWSQLGLGEIAKFKLRELTWGQLPVSGKLGKIEGVFPRADKSTIERMQAAEGQPPAQPPAPEKEKAEKPEKAERTEKKPASAHAATQAAPAQRVAKAAPKAEPAAVPAGTGAPAGQPAAQSATGPAPAAPAPAAPAASADGRISIDDFAKVEMRVGQVKHAEKVKGADKLLRLEVDIGTEIRQVVAGIAEAYAPEALMGKKVVLVTNLQPRKLRGLESNGMIVAASLEGGKPVLATFTEEVPVGARLK